MDAIVTEDLTKIYGGNLCALRTLSLQIPQGIAYSLIGEDGAGKTTAIKLLSGLLLPTKGKCSILGIDPEHRPDRLHRICGVMTPSASLYSGMTGQENLLFFAKTAGMQETDALSRTTELMKDLGIWQARELPVHALPTGVQQRLSLARALVARPKVLLLDEPIVGLDTEGAQAVLAVLSGLMRQEGLTILFATRHFAYAQQLCSAFGILSEGSLVADGALQDLCRKADCHAQARLRVAPDDLLQGFAKASDGFWETELDREEDMPDLLRRAVAEGHDVYEVQLKKPTLAQAYYALLGERGEKDASAESDFPQD